MISINARTTHFRENMAYPQFEMVEGQRRPWFPLLNPTGDTVARESSQSRLLRVNKWE